MKKLAMFSIAAVCSLASAAAAGAGCATAQTRSAGKVTLDCSDGEGWNFTLAAEAQADGTEELVLAVRSGKVARVPQFRLRFEVPLGDIHHFWDPVDERFPCCWTERDSSFATTLPLREYFDSCETNVLAIAVSDALHRITMSACNEKANGNRHTFVIDFTFFREAELSADSYTTRLRIDPRRIFWSEAVREAANWIVKAGGYKPAPPPPGAEDAVYSSWYVFRQTVTQHELEQELVKARELGMKTVILDDGWQNDRGAWTVDTVKFPDLKGHVRRMQQLGYRYLVWFAVPFVHKDSVLVERFRGKYLQQEPHRLWGLYNLDPRYPEVRKHIVDTLAGLIETYGFDGFKLDFIDEFRVAEPDLAAQNGFAGCDIKGVPEAAETLLKEIYERVNAVRPQALIEFRQNYIGPVVRQYGQLLRCNDCPRDFQANRYRTIALRLTSEGSRVHSDMLMWLNSDTVAELKRQVWNVMFSVVQYSASLRDVPPEHLAAVKECIAWLKAHERTLLDGRLTPHRPEFGYPMIEAEGNDERIVAVYEPDYIADLGSSAKPVFVVNATPSGRVCIRRRGRLETLDVPSGGIVELK